METSNHAEWRMRNASAERKIALAKFHIGFTKLGNDLIDCVTFLCQSESPVRAVRTIKMLNFYGERIINIDTIDNLLAGVKTRITILIAGERDSVASMHFERDRTLSDSDSPIR